MDEKNNPFHALESDADCPPDLRDDLIAEIDLMRNVLMAADTCIHNIVGVVTTFMSGLSSTDQK
ncbi:hypothetical protein CLV58_106206 [Spirosoma oryzae]|uniref:Uncharacterized protein n=1 Tax=Spirosoma oryzae TaxID=1469603 RepID=A0A2T0T5U9_9BACT|nr:hypothetical protein [Spirosoma oryzae]PRY41019.1 hypothetical protein CLV58_106206 [Spirosoma oryzae]